MVFRYKLVSTANDTYRDETRMIPFTSSLSADVRGISPVAEQACPLGVPSWSFVRRPVRYSKFRFWSWDAHPYVGVADVALKDLPANITVEMSYQYLLVLVHRHDIQTYRLMPPSLC